MINIPNVIISVIITAALCVAEVILTKKDWRLGLVLPGAAVIAAICFGVEFLYLAAILVVVYAVTLYIDNRRGKKRREMDKMNIQDL